MTLQALWLDTCGGSSQSCTLHRVARTSCRHQISSSSGCQTWGLAHHHDPQSLHHQAFQRSGVLVADWVMKIDVIYAVFVISRKFHSLHARLAVSRCIDWSSTRLFLLQTCSVHVANTIMSGCASFHSVVLCAWLSCIEDGMIPTQQVVPSPWRPPVLASRLPRARLPDIPCKQHVKSASIFHKFC